VTLVVHGGSGTVDFSGITVVSIAILFNIYINDLQKHDFGHLSMLSMPWSIRRNLYSVRRNH